MTSNERKVRESCGRERGSTKKYKKREGKSEKERKRKKEKGAEFEMNHDLRIH